jgi:hypothetical protein
MSKVVLVVSDGLRDDVAAEQMGYLEHLVETKQATRYTVLAELPTVSRVLYETLHTGQRPSQHGITSNLVARLSTQPNIFSLATQHGRVTAAAASHWFSELYNAYPYDPVEHSEVNDPARPIQHGRFYFSDPYPDFELFPSPPCFCAVMRPITYSFTPSRWMMWARRLGRRPRRIVVKLNRRTKYWASIYRIG